MALGDTVQLREQSPEQIFQDLVLMVLGRQVLFILLILIVGISGVNSFQCLGIASMSGHFGDGVC